MFFLHLLIFRLLNFLLIDFYTADMMIATTNTLNESHILLISDFELVKMFMTFFWVEIHFNDFDEEEKRALAKQTNKFIVISCA